jgi:glycosyltransferase involved in cell wall biosynthesis
MSLVPAVPKLAAAKFVSRRAAPAWWLRSAGWMRSLFIGEAGSKLLGWMRRKLGPGIGVLQQFSPRPMCLPAEVVQAARLSAAPTISIVTPSFNQGRYLERTLQSVLGQNYPALEFIVQDGGSRDESKQILERYRSRLHHVESMRDRGQAHAINLGFRHASGGIMAYLNSDDLLLPGSLSCVARFFTEHPEVDVVYGNRIVINERDEEVGRWILPPHSADALLWNNYLPQETMFWRRRIWDRVGGGFNESFHSALDWELWLRFHRAGACFHHLPRFLGAFRIHPQQKTCVRHADAGLPEQKRLRELQHGRAVPRSEGWLRASRYLLKSMLYQGLHQVGVLRDC